MSRVRRSLSVMLAIVTVVSLAAFLIRVRAGQDGGVALTGVVSTVWLEEDGGHLAAWPLVLLTTAAGDTVRLEFESDGVADVPGFVGSTVTVRGVRTEMAGRPTMPPPFRVMTLRVERAPESLVAHDPHPRRPVRLLYLVPSDRSFRPEYQSSLHGAVTDMKVWYRDRMENGKTFALQDAVVEVHTLPQAASFYQRSRAGGVGDFYLNVIEAGFAAVGGRTADYAWVFAIDAIPACGQRARAGGGGVVVIGANDLRGLAGEPSVALCTGDAPETASPSRERGTLAHLLGHAFGLPHPAACTGVPGVCDPAALMAAGFAAYPETTIDAAERAILDRSPYLSPTMPFGSFDTPTDNANVSGEVAVTGWALDDKGVMALELYRSPVSGEPTAANGLVFVGTATFVSGARSDIATAYPSYPNTGSAGWGYMMLTNMLPNQGDGAFTLSAFAKDADGANTLLGTKTIVAANTTSTKPFGTIDTPAQGATVSGIVTNFGWALTPRPNTIPTDGSTIDVYVDGAIVGHPVYNQYRADIANAFPGLNNSAGPVGYFMLDTRLLADGVHTLSWNIRDNANNTQGVGSRYITTKNVGSCVSSLSPTTQFVTEAATVGSVAVTALQSCNWTATSNASFITVTAGASGAGSGSVSYSIAAMTSGDSRTGTVSIGGQTFTLIQQVCSFTVVPTLVGANGGTAQITLSTASGCGWSAQSNASFIAIANGSAGTGTSPITISVPANPGTVRGGTLTIGQPFKMVTATVVQGGAAGSANCVTGMEIRNCGTFSCSLPTTYWQPDANVNSRSISVYAPGSCAWIATPTVSWVDLNGLSPQNPPFGLGTGLNGFRATVSANRETTSRDGGITTGTITFPITQQACPYPYTVSPTTVNVLATGGTAVLSLTTACTTPWTATSNATFMTITSGSSGTGDGTVSAAVATNPGPARTGTLSIGGRTVTVNQSGS